jgi:hypothetical protein
VKMTKSVNVPPVSTPILTSFGIRDIFIFKKRSKSRERKGARPNTKWLLIPNYWWTLFTCIAWSSRTVCTAWWGRAVAVASSSNSKGREHFLDIFTSTGYAGDTPFFSDWNQAFKVLCAFRADKLVYGHNTIF